LVSSSVWLAGPITVAVLVDRPGTVPRAPFIGNPKLHRVAPTHGPPVYLRIASLLI
jgi:hypothetical protein